MAITKLGKYELHEQLGRGGFGTVYRATDTVLGRDVALKILHPQLTVDAEFIERFRSEARRIAAFDHPNIATVYDMGEESGRIFIAMRYLSGGSLRDRLRKEGVLPFEQAMQIIKDVSAGLEVAHSEGLVHRDIKPENILFTNKGQAVISDFGLAKAMQSSTSSSSSSSGGAGTPAYRAPELWRGKPPATPSTDEYSLACVFTEMLSGKQLFSGDTPDEIITQHLVDGAVLPEKWPAGVPEAITAVLGKALAKMPADRYPDMAAFTSALQESLGKMPMIETQSPPPSQPEPVVDDLKTGSPIHTLGSREKQGNSPVISLPVTVETLKLRLVEKSIPYLLIIIGLLTTPFGGVGLMGIVSGFGLFWKKNWARKLGMIFAAMLEAAEIAIIVVSIDTLTGKVYTELATGINLSVIISGIVAITLAIWLLAVLNSQRMAAWTGGEAVHPAGFWAVFTGYAVTIIGLIPALMLLQNSVLSRSLGKAYALFLLTIVAIAGAIVPWNMVVNHCSNVNGNKICFDSPNSLGQVLSFIAAFFLIGLCLWAYFYLKGPYARAMQAHEKG